MATTFLGQIPAHGQEIAGRVMIQGSSAERMRQLVENVGGTVTHELRIIDAVGARLTPSQLQRVVSSPDVTRHIEDLAISPEPDPAQPPNCDVAGALEVQLQGNTLQWVLFNKGPALARPESLTLAWPATLGAVTGISLGEQQVASAALQAQGEGNLSLPQAALRDLQLRSTTNAPLRIQFSHATALQNLHQRDFAITVAYPGDCMAELVPAYDNNAEDTYFPSVVGAHELHRHGIRGAGVTVAIVDSGLWEHPELANDSQGKPRVLARYDAITDTNPDEVFDESGHGTHMASVLARSAPTTHGGVPTGGFKGIAPDASLVIVKSFDVEGQGDFLDIVRGIQFVVENRERYNIRVLNLSFSARPRWHYWEDPINQAVMRAWADGIAVVAAAGNEGPDAMTVGSPGNLPYVITVGAVTDSWTPFDRSDDYIPDFSSRGPTPEAHIKPDVVAPGGHMTGLTRPGSTLLLDNPEYRLSSGEYVLTGTSQAAALVSGLLALLLELEPNHTPDQLKCRVVSSAEPAIRGNGMLAYSPFQQGAGYISVPRAITLGRTDCGNEGMRLQDDMAGSDHYEGPAVIDGAGNPTLPGLSPLYDGTEPEKGPSNDRRWGVKSHIERPGYRWGTQPRSSNPEFDWERLYREERRRIERMSGGE